MTAEQKPGINITQSPLPQEAPNIKSGNIFHVAGREIEFSDNFVKAAERRVYNGTRVIFESKQAKNHLIEASQEGYFIIAYATHKSHYDGRPFGKATRIIRETVNPHLPEERKYTGFALPIAASIASGNQDLELKRFFDTFAIPGMEEDNLFLVDYAREKDIKLYGMEPNTIAFMRNMKRHLIEGRGIGILPEATVEGGRLDENGEEINGLQTFELGTMAMMIRIAENAGKRPLLLPMSMSNTQKVLTPGRKPGEYKVPTDTMVKATIPFIPHNIINVVIGEPIKYDEYLEKLMINGRPPTNETLNLYLERELASITQENERGQYGGNHLLRQRA